MINKFTKINYLCILELIYSIELDFGSVEHLLISVLMF